MEVFYITVALLELRGHVSILTSVSLSVTTNVCICFCQNYIIVAL